MSDVSEAKSSWVYNGVWGVLTQIFCVPRDAPVLPTIDQEQIVSRKPSPGFLRYLKLKFWVGFVVVLILSLLSMIGMSEADSPLIWIITALEIVAIPVGSVVAYLTIHLRFDTMWYVFSDRSMRLRRGIWLIRESTITFENIQNVKVTQGPMQRFFGIADVVVETAGGGGANMEHGGGMGMHAGLIEGVAEAAAIRDSIMSHVRATNTTGLGDESPETTNDGRWSPRHLEVLEEIRDLANAVELRSSGILKTRTQSED